MRRSCSWRSTNEYRSSLNVRIRVSAGTHPTATLSRLGNSTYRLSLGKVVENSSAPVAASTLSSSPGWLDSSSSMYSDRAPACRTSRTYTVRDVRARTVPAA